MFRFLISGFFIVCLILNQIGFLLFFQFLTIKNNLYWEVNKISTTEDLKEIHIQLPFVLPYAYYQNEFETNDASIKIGEDYFRITKQKYSNDSIFLVVVEDTTSSKINEIVKSWVQSRSEHDKPINSNQKSPLAKIIEDNYVDTSDIQSNINSLIIGFEQKNYELKQLKTQSSPKLLTPPPEYSLLYSYS